MKEGEQDWVSELRQIMARLRSPDGCPWDLEQSHRSLVRYLIEESYELADAIESGDDAEMADELGDVLLQVVFHCQIAEEDGRFDLQTAARRCCEKMIRRHPHVFGEEDAADSDAVLRRWQVIKDAERGGARPTSALDGVPASFPALLHAQKLSKKAARTGFDWPDAAGPREKILEELAEIDEAETPEELASEVGDLLFAAVNLARKHGVDAESALRASSKRFYDRFQHVEAAFAARGVADLTAEPQALDDLEAAWINAKRDLHGTAR